MIGSTTLNKLINGCVKRDRSCQQKIYELYYGKMMGVCLRYASNREEAKDLLHDGFIKVFENIGKFNFSGSFDGWVRRIMINTTIDHYRKNKNVFVKDVDEFTNLEMEEQEVEVLSQLKTEDIMKLVQQLSPAYKAVFNMYVIDGLSHKEVAEELGISIGTSKSNLAKGKQNLKKMLDEIKRYELNDEKL